jgi:mycofactocin precursor
MPDASLAVEPQAESAPAAAAGVAVAAVTEESLVEEVSIDGMCGVY